MYTHTLMYVCVCVYLQNLITSHYLYCYWSDHLLLRLQQQPPKHLPHSTASFPQFIFNPLFRQTLLKHRELCHYLAQCDPVASYLTHHFSGIQDLQNNLMFIWFFLPYTITILHFSNLISHSFLPGSLCSGHIGHFIVP